MTSTADLLQDATAALSAARRELLVVSDASHDLSVRISRRAEDLDELRSYVDQVEAMQDELRVATTRAADAADLTVERLRHDQEHLRTLDQHPRRAEQHLQAADEYLRQTTDSPDADEETQQRLSALQAQMVLIRDALQQTTNTLTSGAAELERTEHILRPVVDDLHTGAARLPVQANEHLGAARQQLRQASLTSESAGQNALAAARVTAQSRARLERDANRPQTRHPATRHISP
jgi:hypothetical protein